MSRYRALGEKGRLFGVDAAGDKRRGHFPNIGAELGWLDIDGDRMQVREEEQAFGLVLHSHPAQDRTQQIAEVKPARWLDSGKDADVGLGRHAREARLIINFKSSSTKPPV